MLIWKQKKFIQMYFKATFINPVESFLKVNKKGQTQAKPIEINPDNEIINKFHHYLKKESKYSDSIAPHIFPLWSFIPLFKQLESLPYPLFKVLNQGVELKINRKIPRGPFYINTTIEAPIEEKNKIKLPQNISLQDESGDNILEAKILGVIPKNSKKVKKSKQDLVIEFTPALSLDLIFTKKKAIEFALITGDVNPIHISSVAAKLFGFKTSIMHGFGLFSEIFESIEENYGKIEYINIKFIRPVTLPTKTTLELEKIKLGTRLHFKLSSKNKVHAVGKFQLINS